MVLLQKLYKEVGVVMPANVRMEQVELVRRDLAKYADADGMMDFQAESPP